MTDTHHLLQGITRLAGITLALILLYAFLPLRGDDWWVGALLGIAALMAIAPLTIRRAQRVMTSDRPAFDAAEALLLMLAMLAIGFSAVYLAIDRNAGQFEGLETRVDALYFTVTTLSTVGFGDIHATGQAARLAVIVQIAFNFTLFAFGARLVVASARQRVGRQSE